MKIETTSELLVFNGIDEDARAAMAEVWTIIKPDLPRFLDGFYRHMGNYPDMMALFASEASVGRAKSSQQTHWERLFSGRFDDGYLASVQRIAEVHNRIGLPPGPYIGGYLLILTDLHAFVTEKMFSAADPLGSLRKIARAAGAIDKAVLFDIQRVVATYLDEGQKDYARRLNDLADQFESTISGFTTNVAKSADSVKTAAQELLVSAERATGEAETAANGAKQSSNNVQSVASAAVELTSSIQEISRQVSHTSSTANHAVTAVLKADETIRGLSIAAEKIGQVVHLIKSIAGKTDLLALNATIEAARAGTAGRGFAVVANEVKSLSGQTANATGEISSQITQVQTVVRAVADAMKQVAESVNKINEAASAISGAVEEQGAVTQEISRSANDAASGTGRVVSSIQEVEKVSQSNVAGATQLTQSAVELAKFSNDLSVEAAAFIQKIRSADRREGDRAESGLAARIQIDGQSLDGSLRDLSSKGAAFRTDTSRLPNGTRGVLMAGSNSSGVRFEIVGRTPNLLNLSFEDETQGEQLVRNTKLKSW